ncbi:hypothetical protein PIB30_076987 [Stylosanthes scabra]|uniref:Uncharacterized protein n=1 Tax=Stylosanthes scabra TaxID=79078 RepID=A0ABU6QQG9_9FABA|nr:hypothetical protein [Stylosanthes scabra]
MNRKRKQVASKAKEKLTTPPTRKSLRLVGIPPSPPPNSPKSVLKSSKLLVLALAADALNPHFKAPIRQRFSQRIIAKGGPSRPKPKKVEVINLSSDNEADIRSREAAKEQPIMVVDPNPGNLEEEEEDPEYEEEYEEEDPEESVEAEEIPSSWSLLAPSIIASE